ncbi:MAG: hypothetical protein RQ824_03575 [bacterium]|nr:hypothetical protein [bacterium]
MIQQFKNKAALKGAIILIVLVFAQALYAAETVTGLVTESSFSGIVLKAKGEKAGIKYNTGRETVYSPDGYRPMEGDTVTISYYHKARRGGGEILAVSSLTLVKKDPNRKELESPAVGVVREVGRKNIRFEFPTVGQTISMEMKRGMETSPAGYKPAVGDKVKVTFANVKARFGNRIVRVISKIEMIK